MLGFLFCRGGGGGAEDGLEAKDTCLGSLESNVPLGEISQSTCLGSAREENVLSSVVVWGVSQPSMVLKFFWGVENVDESDGSGDWGLYSSFVESRP